LILIFSPWSIKRGIRIWAPVSKTAGSVALCKNASSQTDKACHYEKSLQSDEQSLSLREKIFGLFVPFPDIQNLVLKQESL